ncbi:hypothetical protein OOK39_16815 [Streptomyces sp. NBC_00264]|uniref:hypothetical protein n=1 Tax=unclassified Streptomyces TaxID=2593676 RepID=UPI002254EDBA|nr:MULTISPECIES: hypothetical protein [unclassified Streptomyces]MCX5160926.1 hypothetical protein [Streptomyces sp. NBC_00305]MCX5219449.1 hypothetical protein [Streptomyces sp. NBC_00264]
MERELYGREAIFDDDGLAARLTGLTPYGSVRVGYEHRDDPPVAVLTGGRGMGKTAVLKQLRHLYREITPVALVDCEAVVAPDDAGPAWTPVTGALPGLATQLTARVRAARPVQFPRLSLGLVAVASISWTREDETRARRDLQSLGPMLATVDGRGDAATGWVTKVLTKLAASAFDSVAPMAGMVAEATVETVLEESFNRFQRRSADWYGSYPHAGGNGRIGLRQLAVDFERGGDLLRRAEDHLVLALAADLVAAYGGLAWGARRGRPVLLVDNAHTPLGRQLVEPLLRQRAAGVLDRIAVFASSRVRDHEGLSHAVRRRLPEVAHGSHWSRGTGVTAGILAVELTPLGPEQVRSAFDRHDRAGRIPAGLARGVHRLTGGRPLAVELLALAAGEAPEPASLVPGSLLDCTVEVREDRAPAQVADELLARLLPGPGQRLEFLSVLAAAHGEDSARLLAESRLGRGSPDGDVALRMRDVLRADDWPVGPGHFVADPLLRALLLHRLRFQDGDHPSYAVWQAVHVSLRGAYGPGGRLPSVPHLLHQKLVLGDAEACVGHLRLRFEEPDVRAWLESLRFIASAPYPRVRGSAGPDPRRAVALGRADNTAPRGLEPSAAELHVLLRRLLHGIWLLSDPLALPDEEVIDKMAHELRQLSGRHPTGNSELWDAATHWPRDIRAWRPLSMPPGGPGPDGGGRPRGDGGPDA